LWIVESRKLIRGEWGCSPQARREHLSCPGLFGASIAHNGLQSIWILRSCLRHGSFKEVIIGALSRPNGSGPGNDGVVPAPERYDLPAAAPAERAA
jgi:hypothetical protein